MRSYIAVTAHYCSRLTETSSCGENGELKMNSDLIGFVPVAGHHFGMQLTQTLLFITDCCGISHNVGT